MDAEGPSIRADRSSFVPSEDVDFLTRFNPGLSKVQEEQPRMGRDEATRGHAAERRAAADDRDQARQAERVDARRATRRESDEARADEQRAQSHARRRQQTHEAGEQTTRAQRRDPDVPDEAPVPNTPQGTARPTAAPEAPVNPAQARPQAHVPTAAPLQATAAPSLAGSPAGPSVSAVPTAAQATAPAAATQPERAERPSAAHKAVKPGPTRPDLERAEAVLRQVKVVLRPGLRSATIQLHPAELGRITIRLRVKDEGVHAVVRAESESTLSTLERHLPELRSMLAQHGFEGAEFDLGLASQGDSGRHPNSSGGHVAAGSVEEEINLDPIALARSLAAAEGGVDLIA